MQHGEHLQIRPLLNDTAMSLNGNLFLHVTVALLQ